jgi:GDP-D-mannose dehydratase
MVSFENPEYTGDITALGTTRLLDAIRRSGVSTRFYQASSSEMFGAAAPPQNEQTPFHPTPHNLTANPDVASTSVAPRSNSVF